MKHLKERSGLYYSVVVQSLCLESESRLECPSPSQVQVIKKNQESSPSRVHYSSESRPSRVPIDPHRVRVESTTHTSRVPIDPHRVRVESTTHTSRVRVESLLIHIESESALKHTCCYTKNTKNIIVYAAAHRRPNGGSYELFLTHASAHNYCPVQLIITTQKCNSNVLYLYITMSYEYMVMSHGGSLVRLRSGPTRRASGPDTVRFGDPFRQPRYSAEDLLCGLFT